MTTLRNQKISSFLLIFALILASSLVANSGRAEESRAVPSSPATVDLQQKVKERMEIYNNQYAAKQAEANYSEPPLQLTTQQVPVQLPPKSVAKTEVAKVPQPTSGEESTPSPAQPSEATQPRLNTSSGGFASDTPSAMAEQIQNFKKIVTDSKKQSVRPDKNQFIELSRNYVNRFTCSGKIETMIIPQDRGVEAEILNDNHDLFLRIAPHDVRSFPLDMTLVCDGQVYLINAIVHPNIVSQEIVLQLPQGMRPISEQTKTQYKAGIEASEGLPLEEKLSLIMQRVYKDDPLPYWTEVDTPTSQSRWSRGHYSVFLQKVIKTGISDLIAWDFVFRGSFPKASIYDEIRKIVRGEVVAFGIVNYDGHGAARVIVTTKE